MATPLLPEGAGDAKKRVVRLAGLGLPNVGRGARQGHDAEMAVGRGGPGQVATVLTVLAGPFGGHAGAPEAMAVARPVGREAQEGVPAVDGPTGAANEVGRPTRPQIVGDVVARRLEGPHPKVASAVADAAKATDHAGVPRPLGITKAAGRGSISLDVAATAFPSVVPAILAGHAGAVGGRRRST